MSANTGWLFYKDYYHQTWNEPDDKIDFISKIDGIKNTTLATDRTLDALGNNLFELETTYPGMLLGSGYQHKTGGDNEFKIGFFFDYTTGLPMIPGSSVKGILRSVFQFDQSDSKDNTDRMAGRAAYINSLFKKNKVINENQRVPDAGLRMIEQEIFNGQFKGNNLSMYQRDIFYDAQLYASRNQYNKIFGTDYITPHREPLKNPDPLMFLKVLPKNRFVFRFRLSDSKVLPSLTAAAKKEIFKQILLDIGAGAKTNVGYGQFIEVSTN